MKKTSSEIMFAHIKESLDKINTNQEKLSSKVDSINEQVLKNSFTVSEIERKNIIEKVEATENNIKAAKWWVGSGLVTGIISLISVFSDIIPK